MLLHGSCHRIFNNVWSSVSHRPRGHCRCHSIGNECHHCRHHLFNGHDINDCLHDCHDNVITDKGPPSLSCLSNDDDGMHSPGGCWLGRSCCYHYQGNIIYHVTVGLAYGVKRLWAPCNSNAGNNDGNDARPPQLSTDQVHKSPLPSKRCLCAPSRSPLQPPKVTLPETQPRQQ